MSNRVVKVRRETIAACMTCPLCNKLFRDATTIPECLHTFCRKCIYKQLSDDEYGSCPMCNIDLGFAPLEKLRPDHSLQDVRAKIFPLKRRKVEAPEIVLPPVTIPVRRKERSLSALVVSTPRVSTQTSMTARRSKSRKTSRESNFSVKKEDDSNEDFRESSSSPETLNKYTQNIRQNSIKGESSSHPLPEKETENTDEPQNDWSPLNCLVEVANRSKSPKLTSLESAAKLEQPDRKGHFRKIKVKEELPKSEVRDGKKHKDPGLLKTAKATKLKKTIAKKGPVLGEFFVSPQDVIDAKQERRINPIWFSLVASEDQEGDAPLPQISASYLRIKDGSLPVSFIQKYLMRKLNLTTEEEVEIRCEDQAVVPTLKLSDIVDLWVQIQKSNRRVPATIGSSAKDFVMVLSYARKHPQPPPP